MRLIQFVGSQTPTSWLSKPLLATYMEQTMPIVLTAKDRSGSKTKIGASTLKLVRNPFKNPLLRFSLSVPPSKGRCRLETGAKTLETPKSTSPKSSICKAV